MDDLDLEFLSFLEQYENQTQPKRVSPWKNQFELFNRSQLQTKIDRLFRNLENQILSTNNEMKKIEFHTVKKSNDCLCIQLLKKSSKRLLGEYILDSHVSRTKVTIHHQNRRIFEDEFSNSQELNETQIERKLKKHFYDWVRFTLSESGIAD